MVIDIICAAALVLFGILGILRGFVRQVFGLIAIVLIALFAVPLGVTVVDLIAEGRDWSAGFTAHFKIGMSLAAAFVIYAAVRIVGGRVGRAIGRRRGGESAGLAPWNRYWGAALSVVKAGILCWLILCFFTTFPRAAPGVSAAAETSWSIRTTRLFNPFERWIGPTARADMEDALVALWKLKRYPGAWSKIVKEESIQDVLKHKRIVELLGEGKGDLVGALTDEDWCRSLRDIDWAHVAETAEKALDEAQKKKDKEKEED